MESSTSIDRVSRKEATYRSFIRELCRLKFVRIPRGNDKGALYNKVSRCCLWYNVAAHSRCSLTTLFRFFYRENASLHLVCLANWSTQRPMPPPNNELSDSRFQRQIRNLPKATRTKEAASCPWWLPPPRGVAFMYCHEIATSTNAATSQSSLELSWRKMLVMLENCRTYINHLFLKRLSVAIVGIDCCSFSSLPVQSKVTAAAKASTCSKQEPRNKWSVLHIKCFLSL